MQDPAPLLPFERRGNADIVEQMSKGANLLLASPREALLPFQNSIVAINQQISALLLEVGRSHDKESDTASHMSTSERRESVAREPFKCPADLMRAVLLSALSQFDMYRTELSRLRDRSFDWFTQDPRMLHLHPILHLQNRRRAQSVSLIDRILLIGSCMSLADDFQAFERRHGWSSKQELLTADFLHDRIPVVQKIGKHLQSFLATFDAHKIDRRRLDAGVRLGTKLNVAEVLGNEYGLGSSLTLILSFEVSRLSRLPYESFAALRTFAPVDQRVMKSLISSADFSSWWQQFRQHYTLTFSQSRQSAVVPGTSDPSWSQSVEQFNVGLGIGSSKQLRHQTDFEQLSGLTSLCGYGTNFPDAMSSKDDLTPFNNEFWNWDEGWTGDGSSAALVSWETPQGLDLLTRST